MNTSIYSLRHFECFLKIAVELFLKNDPRLAELSEANRELRSNFCHFFIGSRYNFAPLRCTKSLEVTVVENKNMVLQRLIKSYLIYNKYINLQPSSLRVFFKNCG